MRIGVTDPRGGDDRYASYASWISRYAPEAEILRLSHKLANATEAERCDGIVLTGGGDVEPSRYGGPVDHPKLSGVDPERDRFEESVLDAVLERPRPFLGICRGMQFVNVSLGGTLHPDVVDAGYRPHRPSPGEQLVHPIALEGAGPLAQAVGSAHATVNSFHHLAVYPVARALRAVAFSDDGLVEALAMPGASYFFLLVQWHPERMQDQSSACAGRIAELFLEEVQRYRKAHSH
jgi:putative glutamine amidotransferase